MVVGSAAGVAPRASSGISRAGFRESDNDRHTFTWIKYIYLIQDIQVNILCDTQFVFC